jgi:hypothetical protein
VPFFCIASDSSKPFPFSSVVSELKFDSLFLTGPVNLRICFSFPCHIWITAGMKMASQLQLSLQTQHQLWLFWDLLWWGLGTRKSYCPPPVSFSWLPLLEAATHGVIFPFWSLVWIHVFTCWIIIYLFIYFFVNYCVWWFFFLFCFFGSTGVYTQGLVLSYVELGGRKMRRGLLGCVFILFSSTVHTYEAKNHHVEDEQYGRTK